MFKQMYKGWWKILGALLVLYSLIIGLAVPIGPGIHDVEPAKTKTGDQFLVHITGYNTHFEDAAESNKVWLRHDDLYLQARALNVQNNDHLLAIFDIPANLPQENTSRMYDLIANNNVDGNVLRLNAVAVLPGDSVDSTAYQPQGVEKVQTTDPAFFNFPYRVVLYETIRNLLFHVPMWFVMTFLLTVSFGFTIAFLRTSRPLYDLLAAELVNVSIVFGLLGFATGALWGHFAWGAMNQWLLQDTKILGALIGLLLYFAYFILRGAIDDDEKRGRISGVYAIFAWVMFIVFIYVTPRMTETLHPGNGGNPAFSSYDLDSHMRVVFYPAVIGWILIGFWITTTRTRIRMLKDKIYA